MFERATRYLRQRRKSLSGAGLAAAATVLLMLGAFLGWRYYADWRLGRVVLTTDGPPLAVDVLPASSGDLPIGEPLDIGTRSVLTLPADDYRLRVSGMGLMSETYRVAVNRGETRTHHLTLDDNRLMGGDPIPFSLVTEAVVLKPGKADFIEWTGETLVRRDGTTGKPVWDAARPALPWSPERDPVAALRRLSRFGDEKRPGELVEPAPDLDGDGTGDLVWAIRGTPSLLALSGKDGSPLWTYSADPGDPTTPRATREVPRPGRTVGTPAAVDVDGDGTTDLVAEFAVLDDPKGLLSAPGTPSASSGAAETILSGRRVVVAVSGRSGKPLWNYLIDRKPTDLPRASFDHGITYVSQPKRPFVALVADSKWIGLDQATGRQQGPTIDLGFAPVLPVEHVDLDGDGAAEILALEAGQGRQPLATPTLVAFSTSTGKRLWVEKLMASFTPQEGGPASKWPLAADLDGDGCAEVVIPDQGSLPPRNVDLYGGIRVLGGRTGQTRWAKPLWPGMKNGSDSLAHLLAAPDLDADGTRDLIVVSRFSGREPNNQIFREPEPARVYVDALSGKDGRRLWSWRSEALNEETTPIWSPFWWGRGLDGWPMLALPVGGRPGPGLAPVNRYRLPDPPAVHLLAVATGSEAHAINGLSWPKTADVDGDGLVDLWGCVDDKLRVFPALAPESWRALGELKPAGDLDGDGITDVLSNDLSPPASESGWSAKTQRRTALARSGRDGKVLWRTLLDPWKAWLAWGESGAAYTIDSLPSHGGDLDGDGFPDVLVRGGLGGSGLIGRKSSELQLQALSGRTGRFLWSAGPPPPLGFTPFGSNIEATDVGTFGPGALPDLLVLHNTFYYTGPTPAARLYDQSRLARLSGRDGRVVWDVLLVEHTVGMNYAMGWAHALTDLDGDGGREIVLQLNNKAASGPIPFELRVISLATGETRWSHPLDPDPAASPAFVVGDLDGDGRSEVIVAEQKTRADGQSATEVTALGGLTGSPLWAWRGAEARDVSDQHLALRLAGFDASGRRDVCVSFSIAPHRRRVEIIDAKGRSRVGRDVESIGPPALTAADLDGDGRDELLFHDGGRLCACRGDLSELWSLSTREATREVFPAAPGQPATVVISSSLGVDGATGRPLWSIGKARSILRESDAKNLPRSLVGPDGTTVCRVAMPASAQGPDEPARGTPAKPSALYDDPRWQRPLPWVGMVEPYADPLVQLAMGATLVNVCIPLAILWLATRRRFWSVRLLLALPAVVAVLLVGFSAVNSLVPDRRQPTEQPLWIVVVAITMISMTGLPIVVYAIAFGSALVRRRWRKIGILVAAASLAAILIAAIMLRSDMRAKPLIEHYDWSGWHQAGYRGAYAVGALMLLARPARAVGRFVSRLFRRRSATISALSGTL
jgi:outer membrane protein assembly factor BamB